MLRALKVQRVLKVLVLRVLRVLVQRVLVQRVLVQRVLVQRVLVLLLRVLLLRLLKALRVLRPVSGPSVAQRVQRRLARERRAPGISAARVAAQG